MTRTFRISSASLKPLEVWAALFSPEGRGDATDEIRVENRALLMSDPLEVRLGSQACGVCGSFGQCGLAWIVRTRPGLAPHIGRLYTESSRSISGSGTADCATQVSASTITVNSFTCRSFIDRYAWSSGTQSDDDVHYRMWSYLTGWSPGVQFGCPILMPI